MIYLWSTHVCCTWGLIYCNTGPTIMCCHSIYNTTGPCMQYSTDPCTTVPCILYYWPMYTVLNIPVKVLLICAYSTSGPCIQYLIFLYTVYYWGMPTVLLVHHVGYWSICILFFWSVYAVLLVREYSSIGMCIQFYWSVYTALGGSEYTI